MSVESVCIVVQGQQLQMLPGFLAGYVAILATPGPNLLAVAGIAALRGLRGVWPLCLGIALGAGTLNAVLLLIAFGIVSEGAGWERIGRLIGALFLLHVAISIARLRPPVEGSAASEPDLYRLGGAHLRNATALGAGFLTALTNPLTGTFFAAWHIGCLGLEPDPAALCVILFSVWVVALGYFLSIAALLTRPTARRAALAWHRPIRLGAAAMLVAMSAAAFHSAFGV